MEPEVVDMAEPEIAAAEIFLAEAEINPPPRFETAELQIITGQAMFITLWIFVVLTIRMTAWIQKNY